MCPHLWLSTATWPTTRSLQGEGIWPRATFSAPPNPAMAPYNFSITMWPATRSPQGEGIWPVLRFALQNSHASLPQAASQGKPQGTLR
jgi:hypothetical protein